MMLLFKLAVCALLVVFSSCMSTEAGESSQEKSFATNADLILATEMLQKTSKLGACSWIAKPGNKPMSIALSFKFSGSDKPLEFSEEFFNDSGAISQVDILYGRLGTSQPYKLILEKVVAGMAPADKYRLSFDIKDNVLSSAKVEVLNGTRWNVVRSVTCQ
jgi:hypothetical protein